MKLPVVFPVICPYCGTYLERLSVGIKSLIWKHQKSDCVFSDQVFKIEPILVEGEEL